MDITRIDPRAALFACRAQRRAPKERLQQIVSWAPANTSRALDVGSGTGALALKLASRASFVVGIDTSPTLLELAQKKPKEPGEANVAWVIASADALPFRANAFDYITSTYALRFSNLQRSLPEIRRTIRPGGRVAIFDSVTRPARFGFWLNYGRDTMRLAPQLLRSYGVRGMCRIVAYRLTTAGVRHTRESRTLAPADFMEIFQRYFPEQDRRIIFSPGRLFWQNGPESRDPHNQTSEPAAPSSQHCRRV